MPLPLPKLDTRRWADLFDEGRALIPRYAPGWTDHNVHDTGITLIELLAWAVEQTIYRLNRVPERHRLKFLQLIGFAPHPPRAARAALSVALQEGQPAAVLPAGTVFATGGGPRPRLHFRTLAPLTVTPACLRAVQVFDGSKYSDQTRFWAEGLPLPLLGSDPQPAADASRQPALYLGFDPAPPAGLPTRLWFWFAGPGSDSTERARIAAEAEHAAAVCRPLRPTWDCGSSDVSATSAGEAQDEMLRHHTVRTVWEYYASGTWQALSPEAGEVVDETRGLTLDGAVQITPPAAMDKTVCGIVGAAYHYLRCRLVAGPPDAAPSLLHLASNVVPVEQATPAWCVLPIAVNTAVPPGQEPQGGQRAKLRLELAADGTITALAVDPTSTAPEALVLDYQAATATAAGRLTATLVLAGWGHGRPGLSLKLPGAPIAGGQAEIWTVAGGQMERWAQRPDLDASSRRDAHFVLDSTTGRVTFGDGERGRVVPAGAAVLALYDTTAGAAGNVASGQGWSLDPDDPVNRSLLGGNTPAVAATLAAIANPAPASAGSDQETAAAAAGRAAEALWAHERLVEICPAASCPTLDQLDPEQVRGLAAPGRATTLLDFERLALDVPGTRVARARAWAGIDPNYPCLQAPGTVTVVVVPELPVAQPQPSPGLLAAVRRYLDLRRTIATRLIVVGPRYLPVGVRATVQASSGSDPARVQRDIVAALDRFLHPLRGGPAGRGWPFGRDVYRSEILELIDRVPGVDHVLALELLAGGGEGQCGNLCLGPTWLAVSGEHDIAVLAENENGSQRIQRQTAHPLPPGAAPCCP